LTAEFLIGRQFYIKSDELVGFITDESNKELEAVSPTLYSTVMNMLDEQIRLLSTLANISPKHRDEFLRVVRELAERLGAPDEAVAERSAVPVEKSIPEVAPELYINRANRRENPEQFILRVYGNPIHTGMSQPDLPRLDPKLHQAYRSWKLNHKPTIDLPTKDEMLARLSPEARLRRRQAAGREASARHRAKASMQ
jgi:hypothetical protein